MKFPTLNNHLSKKYLLLVAAGLFLLSFLTAWYFKVQPSAGYHQKTLQAHIQKQQKDAAQVLADTILMRKLVLGQVELAASPSQPRAEKRVAVAVGLLGRAVRHFVPLSVDQTMTTVRRACGLL